MSTPPGWEGLLDEGEQILWQGRPDQAFHLKPANLIGAVFGLFFAGFALFWMIMAQRAPGQFWMFGLIHFSAGLFVIWYSVFGATYTRRNTWYTLTDRRAFVATDFLFKRRSLKSYPIEAETAIEFIAGPPDTINFAREMRRGSKGRSYSVSVGFDRIHDGQEVMRLIRQAQRSDDIKAETT